MSGDEMLKGLVAEAAGFDMEAIGEAAFARSVDMLMAARGFASRDEYAAAVRDSEAELQDLLEELVVPETWFFRDRGPFEFLEGWARTARHGFLRALSVPCSTGEEAYSIAIALLEAGLAPDSFSIDAVDISRRALTVAAARAYRSSSFREPWERYRPYFIPVENGLAVREDVARLVRFDCGNPVCPAFLRGREPYHVVFCRNLLIYLRPEARAAVVCNMGRLLAPDGILVTGASELPVVLQNGYSPVSRANSFACRKAERAAPAGGGVAAVPSPPPPDASLHAAWQLADQGELEKALEVCDSLLAGTSSDPETYYLKGVINQALDRLDTAEDCFRKTLYLDPHHYPALLHMSALCERRGETRSGDLFRTRARRLAGRGVELDERHG